MNTARGLFILAAIPFTLLAPFLLFMEQAWRTGRGSSGPTVFALCGGAYIYGSIFALRGQLPLSSLVLVGIILNILGACVWMPAFQFSDGSFIGLIGVGLTISWLIVIVRQYRDERH
jgi:hypothetical protein